MQSAFKVRKSCNSPEQMGGINLITLACPMAKLSPAWMNFTCVESSACSVTYQNLLDEHLSHLLCVLGEIELLMKND